MRNKRTYKHLATAILTILILIIAMLLKPNISLAYGTWNGDENGGMPELQKSETGLFPQLLRKQKTFTGNADTEFPYETWTTNVSAGTVYCADSGKILRFGKIDTKEYYLDEIYGQDKRYTYSAFEEKMKNALLALANKEAREAGAHYATAIRYGAISFVQESGPIDPELYDIQIDKPMISYNLLEAPGAWADAFNRSSRIVAKIFNKLGEWDKPADTDDRSTNSDSLQWEWSEGEAEYGPEVVVMETLPGREDGYKKVDEKTARNNGISFILTAMENAYTSAGQSLHTKYSLSDIQTAYWKEVDDNGINANHLTTNGLNLYEQANKYQEFVDYLNNGGYKATIDKSQAQVVSNQLTKNYIVGPFTIDYPYYDDISYIKAIYLKTDEGTDNEKTLVYDENTDDFSIAFMGETKTGSNGLTKKYPAPNTKFYIKFSAKNTNYPKTVSLYADFEYLKTSEITYNELHTQADVYQYIGYVSAIKATGHGLRIAYGSGSITYAKWKWVTVGEAVLPMWQGIGTTKIDTDNKYYGVMIAQPFVRMTKTPTRTIDAQPLTATLDGKRTYEVYSTETSVNIPSNPPSNPPDNPPDNPPTIDLTFDLGGKVWVDGTAGKEDSYDGIYNEATDKPMSNVKVSLYRIMGQDGNKEGEFVAAMTTDENGEYLFKEQNAMYQYYVKFTYNGQYYQPTVYNVDRNNENWNNTSKGLDILDERDRFNATFREIGSAPQNTVDCATKVEMHTREELEEKGLIDEFGNIVGTVSQNGERKSSDEYVNYSMMDSYTCNGTTTKDLYPGYSVFINDTTMNNLLNTQKILEFIETNEIKMIYADPDVMYHINQGYVLRELVDLALRKDVYKATLEINGKTETYKYNKRDGLETDAYGNSYWEIETRIADGYYTSEYSRELYREDYDYKIDNYVMSDTTTTLDNLGLTEDSELKIYVTYKYTIRNRSEGIAAAVTEIVDYYDKDYSYVPERSYLGKDDGTKIGEINLKDSSRYGVATQTEIAGYNKLYITGNESYSNAKYDDNTTNTFPLSDPDSNKDIYLYVTFIVNKDEASNNILDEDVLTGTAKGVGKENIAEINGYKSYYGTKAHAPNTGNSQTTQEYATGDIAGISDRNSTPGNLNPADVPKDGAIKYENFENDTDKAPNIRIILNRKNVRTIEGTVWEDTRTETEKFAQVGNGQKDDETGINGVRVQLVEIRTGKDGKTYEYIWKEVYSGNIDSTTPIINNNGLIPDYTIDTDNANGKYKFTSFAPGNYIVRFIYGSGESSVLGTTTVNYNTGNEESNPVTDFYNTKVEGYKKPEENTNGYSASSANIGLNKNSYNGQDYKSTSYQTGVDNGAGAYDNNTTTSYTYNFDAADGKNVSDAKDIMNKKADVINIAPKAEYLVNCNNSRTDVENYSNGEETNAKAEILASFENIPESYESTDEEIINKLRTFMNNTYMVAESGTLNINFEYNRDGTEIQYTNTSNSGKDNISPNNDNYEMCGYYVLKNLDFGLEQRPKAQLKVTKQITNVKLTLANNSILFDASDRATNVLWLSHTAHGQDTENKYSTGKNYNNNMMLNPVVRKSSTNKGKVQLTMDEELMHGSTIQITYAITVANVGEVDYKENQFYYTGKVGNIDTMVTTNPKLLVDYVGTQVHDYNSTDDSTSTRNNLQFSKQQNPGWEIISSEKLLGDGLVNTKLGDQVNQYAEGHIITTTAASKDLIPIIADQDNVEDKIKDAFKNDPLHAVDIANENTRSVSGVPLILTQMITQDNASDDMTYNNLTELVKTQNQVGRRMAYSIVGNQDPTVEPREIDADDSEEVVILPPFGQKYIYYVLGTAVAVILIAGIIITIMVLKKRK